MSGSRYIGNNLQKCPPNEGFPPYVTPKICSKIQPLPLLYTYVPYDGLPKKERKKANGQFLIFKDRQTDGWATDQGPTDKADKFEVQNVSLRTYHYKNQRVRTISIINSPYLMSL